MKKIKIKKELSDLEAINKKIEQCNFLHSCAIAKLGYEKRKIEYKIKYGVYYAV